jgi:hypothetical protein
MKVIKIGRGLENGNDVFLDNNRVSREHCTITQDDNGSCFLTDHSLHGTKVNGGIVHNAKVPLRFDSTVAVEGIKLPWLSYLKGEIPPRQQPPKSVAPPTPQAPQEPVVLIQKTPIPEIDIDIYDLSVDFVSEYNSMKQSVLFPLNDYKNKLHAQKKTSYHSFSDELLSLAVESYSQSFAVLENVLKKTSRNTVDIQSKYERDMELLENLHTQKMLIDPMQSRQVNAADIYAAEQRKADITKQFMMLKNEVRGFLNEITGNFAQKHPFLFDNQYETAETDSKIWNKLESRNSVPLSTLFVGKNNMEFALFDEKYTVSKDEYLTLLNSQNLVVKYNTDTKQHCLDFVNTLTGRMLAASASGEISVTMIDAEEMDGTCGEFKRLNKSIFGIYAREEDICKQLEEISRHIENVIQNVLHGNIRTLADYNQGKENVEGYKLLIIDGFPTGIGGRSAQLLKKILKNGVRAGVNVILLINEDLIKCNEEARKQLNLLNINDIENDCAVYDFINSSQTAFENLNNEQLYRIVQHINEGFETKREEKLKLTDYLLPQEQWWNRRSAKAIEVPFGLGESLGTENLLISQEFGQNSAIVIGIPGSGKSVFLNTIIANAAIHYSPDELELYLIDFSGVEFDIYAKYALPHAKVIAPESEREFGISILRKMREKGREREELCRNAGVSNIIEYRQKKPEAKMPRIVAIVDEFQKFFQTDDGKFTDSIYYEAKDIINIIVREYRKYGINIILATQTLKGEPTIGLDMIANRIVFKCVPDDVPKLFSGGNPTIQIKQSGECIYNSLAGDPMGNKKVKTYFAERPEQEKLLEEIHDFAEARGKTAKDDVIIFRSSEVPVLNFENELEIISQMRNDEEISVYLGRPLEISKNDTRAVLRKEGAANLLIIGGDQHIAKTIAINSTQSLIINHLQTKTEAQFYFFNFMRRSDPLYGKPKELYDNNNIPFEKHFVADDATEITQTLKTIKDIIDLRQSDKSIVQDHIYLSFYDMQPDDAFRGGARPSEGLQCLEYILKFGSATGVFVIMHADSVQRLRQVLERNTFDYFNHRVALQMSREDSDRVLANSEAKANMLTMQNRPQTKNRAFYFNPKENVTSKFKPYQIYKHKN